jgi:hypothetical protein
MACSAAEPMPFTAWSMPVAVGFPPLARPYLYARPEVSRTTARVLVPPASTAKYIAIFDCSSRFARRPIARSARRPIARSARRPIARSARCDVRWRAAVFVEANETPFSDDHLHSQAFRRLLLQIGGANIAAARIAPSSPPTSSALDDKACLLTPPQHVRSATRVSVWFRRLCGREPDTSVRANFRIFESG